MKKIIFALIFLSNLVYSQEKGTIDYNIGCGLLSTNGIFNMLESQDVKFIENQAKTDQRLFVGRHTFMAPSIFVQMKYAVKNNWFVYGEAIFLMYKSDVIDNDDFGKDNPFALGKITKKYYTLAVGTEYHYYNKNSFQIYSGFGIAQVMKRTTFSYKKSESKDGFNFQLNLIGLRIGNKLAGTLELGFGYKGILNLGLSYQD